jgi:hypothetical protein
MSLGLVIVSEMSQAASHPDDGYCKKAEIRSCRNLAPLPTDPEHVAAKLNDFADNNMLQIINLARILFTWVMPPKWKAR